MCFCENKDAPSGNKVRIWQTLQVLHFDPTSPSGAGDVSEVLSNPMMTLQDYSTCISLVTVPSPKLKIFHFM